MYADVVTIRFLKGRLGAAKFALQNRTEQKPATFNGLQHGNVPHDAQRVQSLRFPIKSLRVG